MRDSGVARCFTTTIIAGQFTWRYNPETLDYEERLLAGRYVITTSLTTDQASTSEVVSHYQSLTSVEARFRVMKDFLGLRPVFHWTETRVRGHITICVLAAVIEAVIGALIAQTKELERAIAVLGLKSIKFEGSDSLDDPGRALGKKK